MSITDPTKIILMSTELMELLAAWNIRTSESLRHTEVVRNESVEVTGLAEKELNRAVVVADGDAAMILETHQTATDLYQRSTDLFRQVESWPEQARERLHRATENRTYWKQSENESREWEKVAEAELQRATREYEIAVDNYNEAEEKLEKAAERLQRCHDRQVRHKDGSVTPSCDSQLNSYHHWMRECERLRRIMEEKKEILQNAEFQRNRAIEALELAVRNHKEALELYARSEELLDWSNIAYRAASDAVSAARSALFMVEKSQQKNIRQRECNEQGRVHFGHAADALQTVEGAAISIGNLSESCNRLNALLSSDLDYKSTLLYRYSKVTSDTIPLFNAEKG